MMQLLQVFPTTRPVTIDEVCSHVGPGWRKLIVDLVADLEKLGWDGQITQVKEKFGALGFYIASGSQEIFDRINEADRLSRQTCEECGKPGKLMGKTWLKTRCDEHPKE